MGILAQRFADDEVRDRAAWLNDEDGDGGSRTPSGVRVTARAALGLTTVWRCVDLLSSAVAQSPKDVIVKVGGQSFPEYRNKPGWLTTPNPLDPTYTANDYFAQVALSLLFDGNYFVHVFPYVFDPQVLTVLAGPGEGEAGPCTSCPTPSARSSGPWVRWRCSTAWPAARYAARISPRDAPPGHRLRDRRRGLRRAVFRPEGEPVVRRQVPYALTEQDKTDLRDQLRRRYAGRRTATRSAS